MHDDLLSRNRRPRRHRRPQVAITAIITTLALAAGLFAGTVVSSPSASPAFADVVGDDERDVFVGSGSLILPGSMPRPGREGAANCPGCEWKATLACDPSSPTACRGAARLCPDHHFWLRISLRRPGGAWQGVGSDCFGPGGPVSRDSVEYSLRELLVEAVPALAPRHYPGRGLLPHLPVAFGSGQPGGSRQWTWTIVGLPVTVTANPRWTWSWSSGRTLVTTQPGSPGAQAAVTEVFVRSGSHSATVNTTWTATYDVDGLGPLTVTQPVVQSASLPVTVGQARAVLTR
jgi:hypothetical protein